MRILEMDLHADCAAPRDGHFQVTPNSSQNRSDRPLLYGTHGSFLDLGLEFSLKDEGSKTIGRGL
ncbi:hypothetical protein FDV58_06955 [Bradyrhizobium elkanii]|uniref:Uncharacterized protein n=1 Tax=Bradyrhizobium elkanii TaxID=29448 RepID=A0A4U6S5L7_BRAEL|nr:hypothetical protein [Bradyrhizobium elkanii]TKV82233.1 hypothetical protein FDV58_06955 [Bradyrhizobium elkanii]